MKKLIGIVVALGLLIVGTYYGMGWFTERSFRQVVQNIRVAKGAQLQLIKYNRGVFHSKALVNWTLTVPASDDQPQTTYIVPIPLTIEHGPMMVGKQGVHFGLGYASAQLVIPEQYLTQMNTTFGANSIFPILRLSLLIDFLNQAHLKIGVPGFHLFSQNDDSQLDWSGLTSSSVLSLNLNHMKGDATFKGLQFHRGEMQVHVDAVSSDYNIQKTRLGLYEGTASFQLKTFQLTTHGKVQLGLQRFTINSSNHEKDGLMTAKLAAHVDKIMVEDQPYGPGEFEMSLSNVDAHVLSKVNQQLQDAQKLSLLARQKVLISLLPELPELFSQGASLSISKLSFVMPEGNLQGHLTLSLPKGSARNPFQVFSHLVGEGHLQVPAEIVQEFVEGLVRQKIKQSLANTPPEQLQAAPAMLGQNEEEIKQLTNKRMSSLVESGALVKQGQDYLLDVKLEHGKIEVNGKPFAPAMLEF